MFGRSLFWGANPGQTDRQTEDKQTDKSKGVRKKLTGGKKLKFVQSCLSPGYFLGRNLDCSEAFTKLAFAAN